MFRTVIARGSRGGRPLYPCGGFGIILAMTIKQLQHREIARMKDVFLLPVPRGVGIRCFVASRESEVPGVQAMAKAFELLWEA